MGFTCQIFLSQSAVYILNHYSLTLSCQWREIGVDLNVWWDATGSLPLEVKHMGGEGLLGEEAQLYFTDSHAYVGNNHRERVVKHPSSYSHNMILQLWVLWGKLADSLIHWKKYLFKCKYISFFSKKKK